MPHTAMSERDHLSLWLAEATKEPATSVDLWRQHPHLPRRLRTGLTFDAVLAEGALVTTAISILRLYEQPVGPVIIYPHVGCAAVLVPRGTAVRWSELTTHWPRRLPRPLCLGRGHALQIPAPAPRGPVVPARWLEPPNPDKMIGDSPLLTNPSALTRCLAEARALLTDDAEPRPVQRAMFAIRSALRAPKRT
ncbi:hypothetical protein ABZ743_24525 [Streptomyces sp. NPDC006662]|uniref:hypothetical protein n=1 Tax=Streptomyces sp. NPDC006662 TaxID=3156902 RepID=UPI0033FF1A3F